MTGYTVHTGATKKFVEGWDRVFSGGIKPSKNSQKPAARKAGGKKKKKTTGQGR